MIGDATFSEYGEFRYSLTRDWMLGEGQITFIMLNPSTATALDPDPTVTRCVKFAQDWGCQRLEVVNLYGLRATNPNRLLEVDDPVGPENNEHLLAAAERSSWPPIAAWGVNAKPERVEEVVAMLASADIELHCLGHTQEGHPKHPLYLRRDTPRERFRG